MLLPHQPHVPYKTRKCDWRTSEVERSTDDLQTRSSHRALSLSQISTRSSCSSERHNLTASWLINQSPVFKVASLQTKKLHTISFSIGRNLRLSERRSTSLHSYPAKFVAKSVPCRPVRSDTRGLTGNRGFNCRLNSAVSSFPLNLHMSICGEIRHAEHHGTSAGEKSHTVTEAICNTNSFDRDRNTDETIKATIPGIACPSMMTVGKSTNIVWQECMVKKEERQKLLRQKGCVIWITGLSGAGKSTLACTLDHAFLKRGNLSYILDGDNLRHGLNKNIGFSVEDRAENIRRIGEVAKLFVDAGIICIASVISPYRKDRDACRQLLQEGEFIEVYMNFPLTLCEERDPKGLYKLARAGKIRGFTGVDDPYEAPLKCEVVMEPTEGRCPTPAEMAAHMVSFLEDRGLLGPPRYS